MLLRILQLTQFTEFMTHSTYFYTIPPVAVVIMVLRSMYRRLILVFSRNVEEVWAFCNGLTSGTVHADVGMFTVQCYGYGHEPGLRVQPSPKAYHIMNLVDLFLIGASMVIYLTLRYAAIKASVPIVRGVAAAIRILLAPSTRWNTNKVYDEQNIYDTQALSCKGAESGLVPESYFGLSEATTDSPGARKVQGHPLLVSEPGANNNISVESMFDSALFNIAQMIEKATSFNVKSAAPTLEEIAIQMLTEKTMLYKEALFCYTVPEVIQEIDRSLDNSLKSIISDLREQKQITPGLKPQSYDFNTIEQLKIYRTNYLLSNNDALKSHATVRFATIMFCDIKGFTSLSDKMPLTHLLKLLEQFFEIVCDETEKHNGKLGAYLGDGAMCIWEASTHPSLKETGLKGPYVSSSNSANQVRCMGTLDHSSGISDINSAIGSSAHRSLAFSSTPSGQFFDSSLVRVEHVRNSINSACLAAFAILRRIRQSGSVDLRKLDCRFGINAGDCVVGVFGCSKKLNYTAISDTVNVASRIETATRIFNSKVLIHSHCVQYLGPKIKARFMGQIEAKGKAEPLSLYEIVESSPEYQALVDITMQVQLLYEAGKVFDCLQLCYETLDNYPGDEIIKAYVDRCVAELKNPQVYIPF